MPSSRSAAEAGGGGVTPVFSLRLMTEGDLEAVLEIEGVSYPTPWSRDSFLHELRENRHARNFVVTRGSLVVGYVCLWVIGGCVQINNIAVHPEYRGRRMADLLMEQAFNTARAEGAKEIHLEVRPSNRAARALYARWGFDAAGTRPGYYRDTGEEAILMNRRL